MASIIKLKRNTTAGVAPSGLAEGEVAVNLKDKILYVANSTVTFELARNTANNGLVLHDGSGNEITITAPSIAGDYSLTLPIDDGTSGQFLQTDGNGVLSWDAPTGTVASVGAGVGLSDSGTASDPVLDVNTNEGLAVVSDNVGLKNGSAFSDNTILVWDEGNSQFINSAITDDASIVTINSDTTITGDLTVSGTTTTLDVTTVAIEDPIVKFANNNTADTTDIGFYGEYNKATTVKYAAFFRDTTDKSWKVYNDLSNEPIIAGGDIDLTGGSLAQLDAVIDGGTY